MTLIDPAEPFLRARDLLLEDREDLEAARARFCWPRPECFNWALDYLDRHVPSGALALHLVEPAGGGETTRTFGELTQRSNQVANYLRALGVGRGDKMLVMLDNVAPLWETLVAAMKLGAVVIPASTLLPAADIADRVRRGGVRAVIADAALADRFAGLDGDVMRVAVRDPPVGWHAFAVADEADTDFVPDGPTAANDPLLLYFTSGTTREPKLVEHTHASYPVGHLSTMYWLGLQPGDLHLNVSSPGWAKHAWSCVFAPWNAGATVFGVNQPRFDGPALLAAIAQHRVTTLCAPPTVWRLLIQHDLDTYPVALREVASAGEPLNPEVIERVRAAWNLTVRDGYGQTETTAQIGNTPGQPLQPGAMGRPLPGYDITLIGPDGQPADEGEVCIELADRPVGLMTGYRDNSGSAAETAREGRYRTGDVARRADDGTLTFVGRSDDVFKASDYRISPFELESVLVEHEAVVEAAVVPSPHPLRLAVPKAFVTLAAGYQPSSELAAEILAFGRNRLAPFKRVRRIEFAELPKTISGKIRRVELRAAEAARPQGAPRNPNEYWEQDLPGFTDESLGHSP